MKRKLLSIVVLLAAVVGMTSCSEAKARHDLEVAVSQFKPTDLIEGMMSLSGAYVDDEALCLEFTLGEGLPITALNTDTYKDDDNVAAMLRNPQTRGLIRQCTEAGYSLKVIFKQGDMERKAVIEAPRLKRIYEEVDSGTYKQASFLSRMQKQLEGTTFPVQLDEITYWTNAFISNGSVCYTYMIDDDEVTAEDVEPFLEDFKEGILANLSSAVINKEDLPEIIEKDIHFYYIYQNPNDIELGTIDISPADLQRASR